MKKEMLLICSLLSALFSGFANSGGNDTLTVKEKKTFAESEYHSFVRIPELDEKFPVKSNFRFPVESEFTSSALRKEFPVSEQTILEREKAIEKFRNIDADDKWIESFGDEDIKTLPVGVKHSNGNGGIEYALAFVDAKIYPQYSELTVFGRVKLPQTDENGKPYELYFGANGVKLSHSGGLLEAAELILLGDFQIPFNGNSWFLHLKGSFNPKTRRAENTSYVKISCDGIEEMGLLGEVQFSRNSILPIGKDGKVLPPTTVKENPDRTTTTVHNRVKGDFNVVASDWNDMIVDVGITPFVLNNLEDKFVFSVNHAILDFSDQRNGEVVFPEYYQENNLLQPTTEAWRGVFVSSLRIGLPKEFKTSESVRDDKRIYFEGANMIIDNYGVSGHFRAHNLFTLTEGRTSDQDAWAYSIDSIGVKVELGSFAGADFSGSILLPISKDPDEENQASSQSNSNKKKSRSGFKFTGIISEDEYLMNVGVVDTVDFDVWGNAKAELLPNSHIELKVKNENFLPKANLNGRLGITTKLSNSDKPNNNSNKKGIEFKGIEFQELVLQSEFPQLSVKYFGYRDEVKIMNFPVSISDISLEANGDEAKLGFEAKLNLMGEGDKGFAANTKIAVVGKYRNIDGRSKFRYDHTKLDSISLKADMGGFKMDGYLKLMQDDEEYGDGFAAELKVELAAMQGTTIQARAIFGKTDFRYWYFDMLADNLPTGSGTPITLKGIGGGAFYRMKRKGFTSAYSPSGLTYIPDGEMGLGLKANVLFGIVSDKAIHGGAGFEILFNRNGGINKMGFYGEAHVMQDFSIPNPAEAITSKMTEMAGVQEAANAVSSNNVSKSFVDKSKTDYPAKISGEAGINGYLGIEYDFENRTLHGELDIYVNVAGNVVQGRASGGRAGWAVIHLSPDEWYLHMGTPDDRLGLNVGFGPVSIEAGGYFMIGDNIPGSPPPPPDVAALLGRDLESLNYMRDENSLGNGQGFAFGHDFRVDTGDLRFLMFYARFLAGGGMDVMLKNYGQARCANTNDQVGINGWYANGQVYSYMQGDIGLHVKLFMIDKKVTILNIGAATLLQAKAPNPIWMEGNVGGRYNVLGGLVKGSCNFKFTLGEECEFENVLPLGGIKMITDVTPSEGSADVDVSIAPQATFAMTINEDIVIPEEDGDKIYRAILDKFRIVDGSGNEIPGEITWNNSHDVATFLPSDFLPSQSRMKVEVEVSFQELVNGRYTTLEIDGQRAVEFEERNFTSGEAPTYIPLTNIVYCYPVINQQQFYRNEYNTGYIKLLQGQDYLFDTANWESRVKLISDGGNTDEAVMNYNGTDNIVSFTMPNIDRSSNYLLSIISTPKSSAGISNNSETSTTVEQLNEDNTFEVTTKNAAIVLQEGEMERLTYEFRVSEHNTFKEKMNSIRVADNLWGRVNSSAIYLKSQIRKHEGFDLIELVGNTYTENVPVVSVESTMSDAYFRSDIDPIIYQKYGLDTPYTVQRDPNEYGFRPKKAIHVISDYLTSLETGVMKEWRETYFPFKYDLPRVYVTDYSDIRHKVLNDHARGLIAYNNNILSILDADFPFMRYGNYDVKFQYHLPGGKTGTSSTYTYKNTIRTPDVIENTPNPNNSNRPQIR